MCDPVGINAMQKIRYIYILYKLGPKGRESSNNTKSEIYLSRLYSCAHAASQNVRLLQASYKAHICAQVNHLDHVKQSFAEYNCRKTSPHTFGSDAENPECKSSRTSNDFPKSHHKLKLVKQISNKYLFFYWEIAHARNGF